MIFVLISLSLKLVPGNLTTFNLACKFCSASSPNNNLNRPLLNNSWSLAALYCSKFANSISSSELVGSLGHAVPGTF